MSPLSSKALWLGSHQPQFGTVLAQSVGKENLETERNPFRDTPTVYPSPNPHATLFQMLAKKKKKNDPSVFE